MSYTITIKVFQTNPSVFFSVVEKTVWNYANGGTWTETNGKHVLTMGGSGTSGMLRLNAGSEYFVVIFGIHNYKRWTDIVMNRTAEQTATVMHSEWYQSGDRAAVREKQLTTHSAAGAQGRKVTVNYTVTEGDNLEANVIIG